MTPLFLWPLLSFLLQSTLPLGVGLLVLYRLQKSPPKVRCLVVRTTFGGLALSLCVAALSIGRIPSLWQIPPSPSSPTSLLQSVTVSTPSKLAPSLDERSHKAPPKSINKPAPFTSFPHFAPQTAIRQNPPQEKSSESPVVLSLPSDAKHSLEKTLFCLWLGGIGVGLARLALGGVMVGRICRSGRLVEDSTLIHMRDELCQRARVRSPALVQSAGVQGPFLCGLLRPLIVVPPDFLAQFGAISAQSVLVHEVAHLARRDLWWQMGAHCLCVLLWPQPLSWVLSRQLEAVQEDVCDEAVLKTGCSARSYAACLLDLAERCQQRSMGLIMGLSATPSRSALARRINGILHAHPLQTDISRRLRSGVVGGALLCAVASPLLVAAQNENFVKPKKTPVPHSKNISIQTIFFVPPTLPQSGEVRIQSLPSNATEISLRSTLSQPLPQAEEAKSLAFSPEGAVLAVGGDGGEIRIYDARTHLLRLKLRGKSNQIYGLAWSPDGTKLCNSKGEILARGSWRLLANLPFVPRNVKQPTLFFSDSVSWSADNRLIASGGSFLSVHSIFTKGQFLITKTREPIILQQSRDWINDVNFSPDGRFLAEGGPNHFSVWDARVLLKSRKLVEVERLPDLDVQSAIDRLKVILRQKRLSKGQKAEKAKLVSFVMTTSQKEINTTRGIVEKVAFSPNSKFLAVAYAGMAEDADQPDGKIVVWDTSTWRVRFRFNLPGASASALAWSPDSRLLAGSEGELAGMKKGKQKHLIRIWDSEQGRLTYVLSGSTDHINALAWWPLGNTLVSGGRDKNLRFWPIPRGIVLTK